MRFVSFGACVLLAVVVLSLGLGAPARLIAQEPGAGEAEVAAPAAPAAAAPAAKGAEPAAGEGASAEGKQQNMLVWLIKTSGWIGFVIFALSFYFVAVVVQEFLALRMDVAIPPEVIADCDAKLQEKNVKGVVESLQADSSFFSRSLLAGVTELKNGMDEAREKLDRTADVITAEMERRVSFLAVLGTLGPMIGLLGTLKGMIASFSVIAMAGVNLEASKVAEGISEALLLTFEGVALSVPAIFFYAFFRNKISKISLEATMLADDYLRTVGRLLKPAAKST